MSEPGFPGTPRFTYGDYVHWPDGERWELIDGVAYDMTPSPGRLHQRIVAELVRQLGNALVGRTVKSPRRPLPSGFPMPAKRFIRWSSPTFPWAVIRKIWTSVDAGERPT